MAGPEKEPRPVSREEFIRERPEVSADQGAAAGPGAPETTEAGQGRDTENDGGPAQARPYTGE